ncbi:MAG: enoyl-CoA hydratase [Alphaproteobacteria bacterium]|nr:enoyl-CoA hydratase [Alphaproteobacteria bacterium]
MIRLDTSGPIAAIRLVRPATRNALDAEGWRALAAAIRGVAASDARVLLLRSDAPGAFCAGSDLGELAGLADDARARPPFRKMMRDAIDALPRLEIPTIAVIDGDCFGAGVALALGCDLRVAGERARIAVTPAKLGISYPREDVERLVDAVGHGQAARLLFAAETIDSTEAARIGLVQLACASAEARAVEIAGRIAENSKASVATLKALIAGVDRARHELHDQSFDDSFGGSEFRDRLAAFYSRRKGGKSGPP